MNFEAISPHSAGARVLRAPAEPAAGSGRPSSLDMFALPQAMAKRLGDAPLSAPLALVDVGASKTACVIVQRDGRRRDGGRDGALHAVKALGVGVARGRGVAFGAVTDLEAASAAVRAAVAEAERQAGARVFHALGALSGGHPRSLALAGAAEVKGVAVELDDMARAVADCRAPSEGEGRQTLHLEAVNWILDGESGVAQPKGLAARRLGVDLHAVTVSDSAVRNMARCLASAELEVVGLAPAALASGLGALSEEELARGAACVDIGAGVTSIGLFLNDKLVFADALRLGGGHVTADLVRAFGLGEAAAERLKTLEGCAVALGGGSERVDLDAALGPGGHPPGARISRADLAAAIRPRMIEILTLARDRLAQAGHHHLPTPRVALTGGGAELQGALAAAEEVFGAHVRLGRPLALDGLGAEAAGAGWSSVVGLAAYAARPPAPPPRPKAKADAPAKGPFSGLFSWLKDSW